MGSPKLKASCFSCRFLEPGIVEYSDERNYISADNLMNIANSFKGSPMIVGHQPVNENSIEDQAVGYVSKVYKKDDGWAWADFTINDQQALDLIKKNGYSISCAYRPTKFGGSGSYHGLDYDREILAGEATHIALVENPRYEEAFIIENSKNNKQMSIINWFKKKKEIVKVNETEEKQEVSKKQKVKLDGKRAFPLEEILNSYREDMEKAQDEEAWMEYDDEDEFDIGDGQRVKFGELKKHYLNKMNNETKEEEKDDKELEEGKKKEEEKRKQEEKNNISDFKEIKNSSIVRDKYKEPSNIYPTSRDAFERGSLIYGKKQTPNQQ